jgi:acetyl esterase/lipase
MTASTQVRSGGWVFRPEHEEPVLPLSVSMGAPVVGRERPPRVEFVFLTDGTYLPVVIQMPEGQGPFPIIICVHGGSGGLGVGFLLQELTEHGWLAGELVKAGFGVAIAEGRREIEDAYFEELPCPLDHHDMVVVARHLARLADVDTSRVGWIGTSHGGELGAKVACEPDNPITAFALCEPAAIEFLGLSHLDGTRDFDEPPTLDDSSSMRSEAHLEFDRAVGDEEIDTPGTLERITCIRRDASFLVYGREGDHLQGVFNKVHELLDRSGLDCVWISSRHPEHVYQWGPMRTGGGYAPDGLQEETCDELLSFFRRKFAR